METWRKNLGVLWFGSFVTSASYSMVVPFLPLFLLQIGVRQHTEAWAGALFSVSFLAGAIISPYWGSLSDRYGRKPMLLRSAFSLFVLYLLTAYVQDPVQLLVLRVLQGLLSGYIPMAIALVGTSTPEHRMGYALSMMATATATGSIVGPLLGGAIAHVTSNRIAFASAGVFVLLAGISALLWVHEDKFVPSAKFTSVFDDLRQAVSNRPLMMVLTLQVLTAFSIMTIEPILPLYIVQLGGSLKNASLISGIVFSLLGIASVMFASPWGRLADRVGFRSVLLIGLIGGGLGNFLQLPFHAILPFSVVRFVYGAFFCAVFPAINGLVVRFTDQAFRGRAFGLNQAANQVGNMLGPMVGGLIGGSMVGVHGVFWVTGAMLLVTAGFSYRYFYQGRYKEAAAQMPASG